MWPFERRKANKTVGFGDILTGMQNAINQVQYMLQNNQLQNLTNFWKKDGQPITHAVKLSDKTVNVPIFTLVPHNQLAMDTVEIKFSTRMGTFIPSNSEDLLRLGNFAENSDSPIISHANLQVVMDSVRAEDEEVMQVSITFKIKDPSEAISRLMDDYNKNI